MKIRNRLENRIRQGGFKRLINNQRKRAFFGSLALAAVGALLLTPFASRSADPVLRVDALTNYLGNTYISLTITNAVPANAYEIHTRPALADQFPWIPHIIGTNGQTNFLIELGPEEAMFYRALACTDCDGDYTPNWEDAAPNNGAITNVLAITILSPTNGATLY